MNKIEFLERLEARLRGINVVDRVRSLDYFSEMIDDCIENGMSDLTIRPVIDFAGLEMESLRAAGTVWGPSLAYLLTGQFNQHPRAAIAYTKAGRSDIDNFLNEVSNPS